MQNQPIYKTAEELGIEQWERDGLVALVGPLSRNDLGMDMMKPGVKPSRHACGSAGCIGGWLWFREHGINHMPVKYLYGPYRPLFFPEGKAPYDATAPQASQAIVNFLVTGKPQWEKVIAEGT